MKEKRSHSKDVNNGMNTPQVEEKSTIIAQILGYSPHREIAVVMHAGPYKGGNNE
jgi:hypothetical protein